MTARTANPVGPISSSSQGLPLTAISNEAALLHREHFGRGPGAVKSYVNDELVVCVLSDPFTAVERTLIEAGEVDSVRRTRAIHALVVERSCRERMEKIIGRPITAYLGNIQTGPDIAVDVFILGPQAKGR